MKKRLLAATLLICMLCSVASCAGSGSINSVYDLKNLEYTPATPAYSAMSELKQFEGYEFQVLGDAPVVHFYKGNDHQFYNFQTDRVVLSFSSGNSFLNCNGGELDGGGAYFWVSTSASDGQQTTLYDPDGKVIATSGDSVAPQAVKDALLMNGVCYRANKYGELEEDGYVPLFYSFNKVSHVTEDYYYETGSAGVTVYNRDFEHVNSYTFVHSDVTYVVLENGNLLVQYRLREPDDAKKYDYVDSNGDKMSLQTLIWKPKSGKTKEIKLDLALLGGYGRDLHGNLSLNNGDALDESIKNVVVGYEIEEKRLISDTVVYSLSNAGKLKKQLNNTIPSQSTSLLRAVSYDRYLVSTDMGVNLLLDKRGEILCNLPTSNSWGETYIFFNNCFYDYDMNLLLDLGDKVPENAKAYAGCYTFQYQSIIYLYKDGVLTEMGKLRDHAEFYAHTAGFIVFSGSGNDAGCSFYNVNGEEITRLSDGSYYRESTYLPMGEGVGFLRVSKINPYGTLTYAYFRLQAEG